MFLPLPMREINIFLPSAGLEATTVALARMERFDLEGGRQEWTGGTEPWSGLADRLSGQRERLEELLDELDIPLRFLRLPQQFHPTRDVDDIEASLREAELEVRQWRGRRHEVDGEIERLSRLIQQLEVIAPLEVPLEEIRGADRLRWILGTMTPENLKNLEVRLSGLPFLLIPVYTKGGPALLAAAADTQKAPLLERALRQMTLEPLSPPEAIDGTAAAALPRFREMLNRAQWKSLENEREGARLSHRWRRRLLALWTQAANNEWVARTISRLDRYGDLYLISGWIPETAVDDVITIVEHTTGGKADIEVLEASPEGPRQAPTLLHNPGMLRPFQSLVTIYGVPNYNEIDPTPLVAASYTVMYGMMFGDFGQGLLLAVLGWAVRSVTTGTARALGAVIAAAGLSGAFFGLLYGSVFGYEGILPTLWIRPLNDVVQLLLVSVFGGIAFLNVGFLLFLVRTARTGQWAPFLFDRKGLAGLALYWALLWGAYGLIRGIPSGQAAFALALVPAALLFFGRPLSRWLRGDRPLIEETLGAFGIQSFFELFEIVIAYVSNTISFVRLGAFAIAHVGFEGIIVLLAGSPPAGIVGWFVLAAGTALIVALEGLVVGLQAIRLEYYEFFSRFFRGEGRPFAALHLLEELDLPGRGAAAQAR